MPSLNRRPFMKIFIISCALLLAGYIQWIREIQLPTSYKSLEMHEQNASLPRPVFSMYSQPYGMGNKITQSRFNPDPVDGLIKLNEFDKSVRSKRSPDEINRAKIQDKHFITGNKSKKRSFITLLNSTNRSIKTRVNVPGIGGKMSTNIEKMLQTETKEQLSENGTIERQSRVIPFLVGFIPSWLKRNENKEASNIQTNMTTPTPNDQKTELGDIDAVKMQNNTIELANAASEDQGNSDCETCRTDIAIVKVSSAVATASTIQMEMNKAMVVTASSIISNINKTNKGSPTPNVSSAAESEDPRMYTPNVTAAVVTISGNGTNAGEVGEKSLNFHNAIDKKNQTLQGSDKTVANTVNQINSVEKYNNENISLIPYENLGSGSLVLETTESNDWLIKYCFDKLVINNNISDELPVSLIMKDATVVNDINTENHTKSTALKDSSPLSEQETISEQESMADLEQDGNNSERGARFLDQLTRFFDFFGSGNSARMVDETSEKIIFGDTIENFPIEEFDDLKFAGQECVKFFQSILQGQTQIAKPNLIDLLIALREEFTETQNPVLSQPINPNAVQTQLSNSPIVPSLSPEPTPTDPFHSEQIQTEPYDVMETTLTEENMVEQFEESVTPIRDSRFLNIFGFGSGGIDNNRKASDKKFGRFFFGNVFNFGSGTGEIDEMEPSPEDNSDEKQNGRFWDFLGFSSGNSREMQSIETSSKIAVERIGKSSKNSINNSTHFRESDTITSKTGRRFFGSLFGSGNFGFLSEEDRVTVAEKTTDESRTSKNNVPISESIQNFSTEKNIEINFLVDDDFGSGQGMNFKIVENELDSSTIQSEEVYVNNFVGVGSKDVELNSLKNASITFTNYQNNLTDNRLNESVESHGRNFFANLFGSSSGDGRSLEESSNNVDEAVTNSIFVEDKTEASGRFLFFPGFGSGEIVFEPQEENKLEPPPKQRWFWDNLPNLGSGERKTQNIEVTDSTDILVNAEDETRPTVDLTNKLYKRFGDQNETEFNAETVRTPENYSIQRTRSREPRLHDKPDTGCNNCDNSKIKNITQINIENLELPIKRQVNFSDCDCNSSERAFQINHLDKINNSTANESKSSINQSDIFEDCDDCYHLPENTDGQTASNFDEFKHTPCNDCADGYLTESETKYYDNQYITYNTDNEQSVTAVSKNNLLPRVCKHSSQCDNSLNEKCTFNGTLHICGCVRSFVKHPVTRKCEPKIILHTVLRFPYEIYKKAFQNPQSEMYREKIKESIEMMRLLLSDNPDLAERVTDFSVAGFSKGSLIVHWNLIVAASGNDTVIDISRNVNKAINESLTHADVLMQAPLKIENVRILSVSLAIDPCQISDLNYCSRHADCTRDNYRPGGFFCQCKPGTLDISENVLSHPGEECKAICYPGYCGPHGDCTNEGNEKECLCRDWYFGSTCQLSGVGLVSGIAAVQIVFLLFGACLCYAKAGRKRRLGKRQRNYLRTHDYGFGECYANPQVNDIVALNEQVVGIPSKFCTISLTPALPQQWQKGVPEIKVIPPSISNMSYSGDSSFETPSDVSSCISTKSMTS